MEQKKIEVTVSDAALRAAAAEGMDAFVGQFVKAIREAIGGELTAETMGGLVDEFIETRVIPNKDRKGER